MKTAQEFFDGYAISHQNETNNAIHYICVPLIFFSVIGLLMSIPTTFLENLFGKQLKWNWSAVWLNEKSPKQENYSLEWS